MNRVETTPSVTNSDVYQYDAIDQVTSVGYGSGRTVSYTYDSTGNRTNVADSGTSTLYTVNNLNEYTAVGSLPALAYDGNANLAAFNGANYGFDAKNRMTTASTGTNSATLSYDGLNRCVSRTINGLTIYFYYAGWKLIEEHGSNGNKLVGM